MTMLLDARGLTVELPTEAGWIRPVSEVSLRIAAGESLGLVGESGSGKTMLALALMGLLPPGARMSGEATLADGDTSPRHLTALPSGCAFEPRCALRRAECSERVPDLRSAAPGHTAHCVLV
jgi:oligopeptide/dipeptide ABC transporter ATP-binding protein